MLKMKLILAYPSLHIRLLLQLFRLGLSEDAIATPLQLLIMLRGQRHINLVHDAPTLM